MGGSSTPQNYSFEAGAVASIELPARTAQMLQAEAKRARKPIGKFVLEWLEDQEDGRKALRRLKSLETGKTKASSAADVYARLGI